MKPATENHDTPSADPGRVEVLLVEILSALQRLPESIAQARLRPSATGLSAADRAHLECLLPSISLAIGDMVFTTKDLIAQSNDDSDLALAIHHAFGKSRNAARRLGMLFGRCAGVNAAGHVIYNNGRARDGDLWIVKKISRDS